MTTHRTEDIGHRPSHSGLEYDLAHDDVTTPLPRVEVRPTVQVATKTDGYDGDYGYDLAHDIPRAGPPPPNWPSRFPHR